MRTIKKLTERQVCRSWLEYMSLIYPLQRKHVIKIDNEGITNRAAAVKDGLYAGASDYFIAWPTSKYYGCWIEVKSDGWKRNKSNEIHTERQLLFGKKMMERGYAFYFCVGLDEMISATKEYMRAT